MLYNWEDAVASGTGKQPEQAAVPNDAPLELNVAQVNLFVRDFDGMRAYYQRILGVKARDTHYSEDWDRRACVFDLPALQLVMVGDDAGPECARNHQQLVFSVRGDTNVDAFYERIKDIPGGQVRQFPRYTKDHRYEIIVSDPEDNTLVFRD